MMCLQIYYLIIVAIVGVFVHFPCQYVESKPLILIGPQINLVALAS